MMLEVVAVSHSAKESLEMLLFYVELGKAGGCTHS